MYAVTKTTGSKQRHLADLTLKGQKVKGQLVADVLNRSIVAAARPLVFRLHVYCRTLILVALNFGVCTD